MAVLVTGGAGYIGSHMVLGLLDAGEDVLALDDLSTGFRWAVPREAKFIEGNVGDHELVRSLMRCEHTDAVIHLAGSVVVPSLIACAVDAEVPNFIIIRKSRNSPSEPSTFKSGSKPLTPSVPIVLR